MTFAYLTRSLNIGGIINEQMPYDEKRIYYLFYRASPSDPAERALRRRACCKGAAYLVE
jgi:hypothetical protein